MTYTTQMDAARRGIVTRQMRAVAAKENLALETLMEHMASGVAIIPANKNHPHLDPEGVGQGLRTKINVNLGISKDSRDLELEMEKVRHALRLGAEAIMDLSCFGHDRHGAHLRRRGVLRQEPIRHQRGRVLRRGPDPCGRRGGFFDHPLRPEPADRGADREDEPPDLPGLPRRLPALCLDEGERRGKSLLRALRPAPGYLREARCTTPRTRSRSRK